MNLNNKINCIRFHLPNKLLDALLAHAKDNDHTTQEEILFRIENSLEKENNMQVSHRLTSWLVSRKLASNKKDHLIQTGPRETTLTLI